MSCSPHRRRGRAAAAALAASAALCLAAVAAPAAAGRPAADTGPTFVHTFTGQLGAAYGGAVSELADVDGDGATDIVIGSPGFLDESGEAVGLVEVRSGRTGSVLHAFHGRPGERFGYSIADAGDVDGDGTHDVAVGASYDTDFTCSPTAGPGRVAVFSGSTGKRLLAVSGKAAGDRFGAAVAAAGDVDGDGRGDILVGAPCFDGRAGADSGAAYVVSGRDGHTVRTHVGRAPGDSMGWGAGSLRDDGRVSGYAVGAIYAGPGDRGQVTVFDSRSGDRRFAVHGDEDSLAFGWYFAGSAGDVNRDGRDDLYVGDFCGDDPAGDCSSAAGQAYVFSGRHGRLLHQFASDEPGAGMGPGRAAGDVNHDGYDDVVVGSYLSSAAAPFGGLVQVFSGRSGHVLLSYADPVGGDTLGFDAVGIGDVNGDHEVDLVVSASHNATVYVLSR